jgi:hypothetical protein
LQEVLAGDRLGDDTAAVGELVEHVPEHARDLCDTVDVVERITESRVGGVELADALGVGSASCSKNATMRAVAAALIVW